MINPGTLTRYNTNCAASKQTKKYFIPIAIRIIFGEQTFFFLPQQTSVLKARSIRQLLLVFYKSKKFVKASLNRTGLSTIT